MSDPIPFKRIAGGANGKAHGGTKPTLTITLEGAGVVSVSGPIMDRTLAYGMLACAKDAIYDFHRKRSEGGTEIVQGTPEDVPPPPKG